MELFFLLTLYLGYFLLKYFTITHQFFLNTIKVGFFLQHCWKFSQSSTQNCFNSVAGPEKAKQPQTINLLLLLPQKAWFKYVLWMLDGPLWPD